MFEATTLSGMIDSLDYEMPDAPNTMFYTSVEYGAWKNYHNKAKEVQNFFNTKANSIENDERQRLWDRFNSIRDKGNERFAEEKNAFSNASNSHYSLIMNGAKSLHWSAFTDILFFFDPTQKEEILASQQSLNELKSYLSKHKNEMSKAHKDECWERFQEIQDSHNRYFNQRREAYEQRQQTYENKKSEWRTKTQSNIDSNREKLSKAERALEHAKDNRREAQNKRDETTSDKWRDIFSGWIDEADAKISSIEETIDRIEGWISESEQQLYDS